MKILNLNAGKFYFTFHFNLRCKLDSAQKFHQSRKKVQRDQIYLHFEKYLNFNKYQSNILIRVVMTILKFHSHITKNDLFLDVF